jgi:hypothetical protein
MAQLLSFFNAIIILSYLGVAVSESKIIEEFMSLRLKYFYGETYLKMKQNQINLEKKNEENKTID